VILSRIFTCSIWGDNLFFKMVESLVEQIEAAIKCHVAKDLSVFTLIPEFTGRPGDLKVRKFLYAVNSVGRMGSWIEDDKKYTSKLKLGGVFI